MGLQPPRDDLHLDWGDTDGQHDPGRAAGSGRQLASRCARCVQRADLYSGLLEPARRVREPRGWRHPERCQAFGARGDPNQSGAINFAWDFAIDPCTACATAGDILVANRESHQIQAFSPAGTSLFIYGSRGSGPGQFTFPQGIAFAPNGTLYLDDFGNDRIEEFTVGSGGLTYVASYGTAGSGSSAPAGDLNMPTGITVSPDGSTLWVADTLNNRIQSLNLSTRDLERADPQSQRGRRRTLQRPLGGDRRA